MEIKDLVGLSEPLTKLIEVVSNGIGTVFKPRVIRKKADAEAYRIEILAKAEAKKIMIEGDAKIELLERAKKRLVYQELTRQENIEEIAEKSIKYLDAQVSDKPVDKDWQTRFFTKIQDVSNENIQELWAKILAGEVSSPGKISLRTLDVVSNLSKKEAELFQIACSIATQNSRIWKLHGKKRLEDYGLSYPNLMMLRDARLVHDNDNIAQLLKVVPDFNISIHYIGNDLYQIKNLKNPSQKEFRFNQISFTNAGREICELIEVELNKDFIENVLEERKDSGFELEKVQIITNN